MPKDAQRFRKIYPSVRTQPIPETTAGASVDTSEIDWKESCRVATVSNISLVSCPSAIDGVTLAVDDRVLVKNQSTASQNGIYYFDGADLVRTADGSGSNLTSGAAVYIEEGDTSAQCAFILTTTNPITAGSTSLTWVKFAGAGSAIFVSTTSPTERAKTAYSVSFDTDERYAEEIGSDVVFFVSGSDEKKAVFGGDVHVSGTTSFFNTIRVSGSLHNADGTNLITAGSGISITQDLGTIEIGLTPSVEGPTAPTRLQFLAGTNTVENGSGSKASLGMDYFNTSNLPGFVANLTYTFCAIGKVASGTVGYLDLYDHSGAITDSIPGSITGSTLTFTSSGSYEYVSVSVDYITGALGSTILEARAWCAPSGTNLNFICKGAWLEIASIALYLNNMGLPTLTKTWQHNANNNITAQGSNELCVDAFWLAVKNAMKGFASSPWTVVSSSNGTTSGASDLWSTAADLVHHGTTRSWIVLKQTGMCSGNFQICIDFNSSTVNLGSVIVSPNAGFTGGSTTARPTATDEYVLINATTLLQLSSDVGTRWSVQQASDGSCTRILLAHGGAVRTTIFIETPNNAVSGWSNPFAILWAASSTLTFNDLFNGYYWKTRIGSTNATGSTTVEGVYSSLGPADTTWGNIANEVSGEWPMWPLGFAVNTVGVRGRHGSFFDLWVGSGAIAAGDTYPSDGSNQFVQWGYAILPWNGGAVNFS